MVRSARSSVPVSALNHSHFSYNNDDSFANDVSCELLLVSSHTTPLTHTKRKSRSRGCAILAGVSQSAIAHPA
eukprot:scaffold113035_cov35-Tisochrysis_lutea.AAC.5